ncbi:hypothetical protein V1603_19690 [Enterobacter sp. ECC-219]|uniref:hypothetical protein n=1 Tax=Enterobacter sp. ECC-219 TaxID=3116480 RepID=UPI003754523F
MSTITKQWLQQAISQHESMRDEIPFGLDEDDSNMLAALRIALASLEEEAVCYLTWHQGFRAPDDCEEYVVEAKPGDKSCDGTPAFPVYTASPAPASVPDELSREEYKRRFMEDDDFDDTFRGGWNACRAAMLQGAEPVTTACKLSPHVYRELVNSLRDTAVKYQGCQQLREQISKTLSQVITHTPHCSNSPVIPDCSCLTCRPVTMADMRFVVCPECGNKRCPHANDHRNACTGSNEPGQEGSSYPAAPLQEVKP